MVIRGYSEKKQNSTTTNSDTWSGFDSDEDLDISTYESSKGRSPRDSPRSYQYYSPRSSSPRSVANRVATPYAKKSSPLFDRSLNSSVDSQRSVNSSNVQVAVEELYSKIKKTLDSNRDYDHADVNLSTDNERVIVKFVEKRVETKSVGVNTPTSSYTSPRDRIGYHSSPRKNYSPSPSPGRSPSPDRPTYVPRSYSPSKYTPTKTVPSPQYTSSYTPSYSSSPRATSSSPSHVERSRSQLPYATRTSQSSGQSPRSSTPGSSSPRTSTPTRSEYKVSSTPKPYQIEKSPERNVSPVRQYVRSPILSHSPTRVKSNNYQEPDSSPKLPTPKMDVQDQDVPFGARYGRQHSPQKPRSEFSPRKFEHDAEYLEWQKKLIRHNKAIAEQHDVKQRLDDRLAELEQRINNSPQARSVHTEELDTLAPRPIVTKQAATTSPTLPSKTTPSPQTKTPSNTVFVPRKELVSGENLHISVSGVGLLDEDLFGKADPYYVLYRRVAEDPDASVEIYRSEVVKRSNNPKWTMATIPAQKALSGDLYTPLKFRVYDRDEFSQNDFLGACETTGKELQECSRTGKPLLLMKDGKPSGEIYIPVFEINDKDHLRQIASVAASRTPNTKHNADSGKPDNQPETKEKQIAVEQPSPAAEKIKNRTQTGFAHSPKHVENSSPVPTERRQVRFGDTHDQVPKPKIEKQASPTKPLTTDEKIQAILQPKEKNRTLSVMLHKLIDDRLKVDEDLGKIENWQLKEAVSVAPKPADQVVENSKTVRILEKVVVTPDDLSSPYDASTNEFLTDTSSDDYMSDTKGLNDYEAYANLSVPKVSLEEKEKACLFLMNGMQLKKFTKDGSGAPIKRFIWIDGERRTFHWTKGDKRVSKQPRELKIADVRPGVQVAIKRMNSVNQKTCFTLDTKGGSGKKIRLICPDEETCQKWVSCVRTVLAWHKQRSNARK